MQYLNDFQQSQLSIRAFVELISENPVGVHVADLSRKVSMKIGYQFNP